jgi:hypothetical protein
LKQGIKNTLALPIDTMLYTDLLCPHSEHQKNLFKSKQLSTFTKETGSNKVKLPEVGGMAKMRQEKQQEDQQECTRKTT